MPVREERRIPKGPELRRVLKEAKKAALMTIGVATEKETKRLFEVQGEPAWTPLSPATIAAKGSSSILIDTGLMLNSIRYEVDEESGDVKVGVFTENRANIAMYHELGSPITNLPRRSFMVPAQVKTELLAMNIAKAALSAALRGIIPEVNP